MAKKTWGEGRSTIPTDNWFALFFEVKGLSTQVAIHYQNPVFGCSQPLKTIWFYILYVESSIRKVDPSHLTLFVRLQGPRDTHSVHIWLFQMNLLHLLRKSNGEQDDPKKYMIENRFFCRIGLT